jgi:enoyl-CoA hydratase/carnithine racemase
MVDEGVASLSIATDAEPYLDGEFVDALAATLPDVTADPATRVLLLEGGSQHFCAGASSAALIGVDFTAIVRQHAVKLTRLVLDIPVPTIAVMSGHGIGGGLALGLWCDAAVLAEEGLYGANFMALGFTPGMGSAVVLEEALGASLAREMLFTGRVLKGREIKATGAPIGHAIVPRNVVRSTALSLARDMAAAPRDALLLLKAALAERRRAAVAPTFEREEANHATLFSREETKRLIRERYSVQP